MGRGGGCSPGSKVERPCVGRSGSGIRIQNVTEAGDPPSEQKSPLWGVGDPESGCRFFLWGGRPQVAEAGERGKAPLRGTT